MNSYRIKIKKKKKSDNRTTEVDEWESFSFNIECICMTNIAECRNLLNTYFCNLQELMLESVSSMLKLFCLSFFLEKLFYIIWPLGVC